VSATEFSGTPPHPPPGRARPITETRTCASCDGGGYIPIDHRYDLKTGLLTIICGPCRFYRRTGVQAVYPYRMGNPWGSA
jgi:hypothetical protein